MNIMKNVRGYAAESGIAQEESLKRSTDVQSMRFVQKAQKFARRRRGLLE